MRNKLIICSMIAALSVVGCSKEDNNAATTAGNEQSQISSTVNSGTSVGTSVADQTQGTAPISGKTLTSVGTAESQNVVGGSVTAEQK